MSISDANSDIRFIKITKEKITTPYFRISILMNMNQKIYMITYSDKIKDTCNEPDYLPFISMALDFPVPFKTGDIVYKKNRYGLYRGIMVYDESNNSDIEKHVCYKLDDYKRIERINISDYLMDLEYYHEEFPKDESILYVLSYYLNSMISLDCLLNSYLLDTTEKQTRELKDSYNYINNYMKFLSQETTLDDEELPF